MKNKGEKNMKKLYIKCFLGLMVLIILFLVYSNYSEMEYIKMNRTNVVLQKSEDTNLKVDTEVQNNLKFKEASVVNKNEETKTENTIFGLNITDHNDNSKENGKKMEIIVPSESLLNEVKSDKSETVKDKVSENTNSKSCQPRKNLVYFKTHKTASSAVQNVLMRKAWKEKWIVLRPRNDHDFGYPGFFNPPRTMNTQANILCHHTRFHYQRIKQLMPEDSLWVSSVREPLSLYRSSIKYFRPIVPAFQRIGNNESIEKWYDNAENYVKTSPKSAYSFFTRSHMLYDFGYDNNRQDDRDYVKKAVAEMDNIFDLVLVSDYFDESMVLLSDLLCWPIEEFACLTLNARKHSTHDPKDEERIREKVRKWNEADATIFDHFNATLWRKIKEYGTEKMSIQLEKLQLERERMAEECLEASQPIAVNDMKSGKNHVFQPKGVSMTGYELSDKGKNNDLCRHFVEGEISFSKELFNKQLTYPKT